MSTEDSSQFSTPVSGATPDDSHPDAASAAPWQPPTVEHLQSLLPQFEILSILGRGGMGAVYKARQITLNRLVAIKLLPTFGADLGDGGFAERFKNEARIMAMFMHPAIVAVFDFGETAEGHLYFIMEFVEGTDVQKMIVSEGKLPADYAIGITAHVCDALQYAHARGVIHRDIKPANVLINMEGQVKVADFGLSGMGDTTESKMTMGTPDFIAPEAMILDVEVDHRADLYSVGVMLYNMLTGELPRGEYVPASQCAGCDVRFDAIIARALQAEREDRYQSALEIRHDLDRILTTPVVKERPGGMGPRPRGPRGPVRVFSGQPLRKARFTWVVPALLTLSVFGGLAWFFIFKPAQDAKKGASAPGAAQHPPAAAPQPGTTPAAQPPANTAPAGDKTESLPAGAVVIEALIDGPSELRVTKSGLYWINVRNAKPGRHLDTREPTYVNGEPWQPQWKDDNINIGSDISGTQPVSPPMDAAALELKLLSVKTKRGDTGIDKRDAIQTSIVEEELSVLITDSQTGSRWYKFALVPKGSMKVAGTVDTEELLGTWRFSDKDGWSGQHIFFADGTVSGSQDGQDSTSIGAWKVEGNRILLIYIGGGQDQMLLPLDPKGTKVIGRRNREMTAVKAAP